MMTEPAQSAQPAPVAPRKSPLGIRVIGTFKLVCAALLVMLGVGIFREIGGDPALETEHLVATLKLDPRNQYVHGVVSYISGISPRRLFYYSVGTFIYALLYAIEATGLLLHKRWGEYFTILMTGLFIPLEVVEVLRRRTLFAFLIFAVNVAIVAYLVVQLRRSHRLEKEAARRAQT